MKISLILNRPLEKTDGLSRVDKSLLPLLQKKAAIELVYIRPLKAPTSLRWLLHFFNKNLQGFLNNIPCRLSKKPTGEVVHFLNQGNCIPLLFMRKNNIVLSLRDVIPLFSKDCLPQSKLLRLWYYLSIFAAKRAARIITDSQSAKREIIRFARIPGNKITVIPLAIDHEKFNVRKNTIPAGIDKRKRNILFVGSEFPRKNLSVLITAVSLLKKRIPNINLIKIGEPGIESEREKLLKIVKGYGLKNNVSFLGHIEEELPDFYRNADLFVFPSKYEGFGLPVLEAMACGCPVVCSNAASMLEVAGSAAVFFNPHDPEEMADVIYSVLTNDSLRNRMIKKGLKRIKCFSWERTAEAVLSVYLKLKQEGGGNSNG